MDFEIKNINADYSSNYNPETANNGGGYWQFFGDCDIVTENGVVIHAEYSNSSCGDFGLRFNMSLKVCGMDKEFNIWEDHIFAVSDDDIVEQYDRNCDVLDKLYEMTGVEGYVVDAVAEAIECSAYDKYCAEH